MPSRASIRHASFAQSSRALPPCPIICIGACFISELLYPWVTSSGKSVEALSSPGRGWVRSRPRTTLINAQSKSRFGFFLWRVGTSDILLDAVRSCVPSTFIGRSVDIEAVALGNSVSVHYTVDLGSTNTSISNLSIYPRPSSSSRPAPSRPVTSPLPILVRPPPPYANANSLLKGLYIPPCHLYLCQSVVCDCDAIVLATCKALV